MQEFGKRVFKTCKSRSPEGVLPTHETYITYRSEGKLGEVNLERVAGKGAQPGEAGLDLFGTLKVKVAGRKVLQDPPAIIQFQIQILVNGGVNYTCSRQKSP